MLFKLFFLAFFAATSYAFPMANGCHWWLFVITCKGPAQTGTPVVTPPTPPAPPCTSCTGPCPPACAPGVSNAQKVAGSNMCLAPAKSALYNALGDPVCCSPLYDPVSLGGGQAC